MRKTGNVLNSKKQVIYTLCVIGICGFFVLSMCNQSLAQETDTLWIETWEGTWTSDWHADAGTWEGGIPTSGPDTAHSGQNCAATVLGGNYSEPVDTRLIRHTSFVVPSASENPRLRFWHWYSFSEADYGEVHIKVNDGDWQAISARYTSTGSGVWTYPFIDLSAYADSTVQVAFYFHSHKVGTSSDVSTGWYIDDIAVITGPVVFSNPENFETGIGDWAAEKGTWEVGEPASGPGSAFTDQHCAATRLNGNYAEPVDSRLISPSVVLSSHDPTLQFWHWYSFSEADYGEVQIRVNDGDWQVLSPQFINTSSGAWTNYFLPLSAYADSTVQIAFYFHSHKVGTSSDVSTGWYIDDIVIDIRDSVNELTGDRIPFNFKLKQNYPNPFNPLTTISYYLPRSGQVTLAVYNVLGQEIIRLIDGHQMAGQYAVQWDGRDYAGNSVSSGVYFYRLKAGASIESRKMLLLR